MGPSGSGKTTFAQRHFKPTEVVSSDKCRGMVSDDEMKQSATPAALEVLHLIVAKRLEAGLLTVVDATNLRPQARNPLLELAQKHQVPVVAVVFDMPESLCLERNKARPGRTFGPQVVKEHVECLKQLLPGLGREGFSQVVVFNTPQEADSARVQLV